jgi:hypothetical protein
LIYKMLKVVRNSVSCISLSVILENVECM